MNLHADKRTRNGTSPARKKSGRVLFGTGLFLCTLELWKQCYLTFVVCGGSYPIWYFPFQLCSMPMYFCLLYGFVSRRAAAQIKTGEGRQAPRFRLHAHRFMVTDRGAAMPKRDSASTANEMKGSFLDSRLCPILAAFMADFGLLGGAAALLVHDGFTFPAYPLLTVHGYVWHMSLIGLSLYITRRDLSAPYSRTARGYLCEGPLFCLCAALAEAINIALHRFGDCDMFYISPYHISSQPVFQEIDRVIGRIPGIFVYLGAVLAGGFLVHGLTAAVLNKHH